MPSAALDLGRSLISWWCWTAYIGFKWVVKQLSNWWIFMKTSLRRIVQKRLLLKGLLGALVKPWLVLMNKESRKHLLPTLSFSNLACSHSFLLFLYACVCEYVGALFPLPSAWSHLSGFIAFGWHYHSPVVSLMHRLNIKRPGPSNRNGFSLDFWIALLSCGFLSAQNEAATHLVV